MSTILDAQQGHISSQIGTNDTDVVEAQPTESAPLISDSGVDSLKNKKLHLLTFEHMASRDSVSFPAMIKSFQDAFKSKWASEQVYGRMDPFYIFENTNRTISVSWTIPAYSIGDAQHNLNRINKLSKMLYPLYDHNGNLQTAPLWRVKFANLITDVATGDGLVCACNGFTFQPVINDGFFDPEPGLLLPKNISISVTLNVLHTHKLGYENKAPFTEPMWRSTLENEEFGSSFPYHHGLQMTSPSYGEETAPIDDSGLGGSGATPQEDEDDLGSGETEPVGEPDEELADANSEILGGSQWMA